MKASLTINTHDCLEKNPLPSKFFTTQQHYSYWSVFLCFCFALTTSLKAEQLLEHKKQPLQFEFNQGYTPEQSNNSSSTNEVSPKRNEMINGLIKIRRIKLQGDVLYPEYGFTENFLNTRINQVYSHMNERLSINDMNIIADALTLAYREKGLTFNQAYVAPQEIVDSTLTIHVLKGTLAEIDVYNNEIYTTKQLTSPFAELLGKVIYEEDIKKIVSDLNNKPGLKIFSFFSVGSNQGEARLNIKVMEETRHQSKLVFDNKGVSQTGINRLMYSHTFNNPFNFSGQLRASVLTTNKQENYFGSIGYNRAVNTNNQLSLSILRSDFAVSGQFEDLKLAGDLSALTASWTNTRGQSKKNNIIHTRRISIASQRSSVISEVFPDDLNEAVDYSTLSGSYQLHFIKPFGTNSQHILSLVPAISSITRTNNDHLPSNFWLTQFTYDFMTPKWLPTIETEHPFRFAAKSQFTTKKLPSSEQFFSTGASANRGFEPGIFSGNSGVAISFEQEVDLALDVSNAQTDLFLRPFLFFDYSYAEQEQDIKLSATFYSAGLGFKIAYKNLIQTNLTIGHPLDHSISGQTAINPKKPVVYADLSFHF